jgi:hypothetical protein
MKQAEQTSGVPLAGLAVNPGAVAGINEGARPAADDDARAWNPAMTCQGCRASSHTSLDERA